MRLTNLFDPLIDAVDYFLERLIYASDQFMRSTNFFDPLIYTVDLFYRATNLCKRVIFAVE